MQSESLARAENRMKGQIGQAVRVDIQKPFKSKPGALRGESRLLVKTHLAQRLVFGRTESRKDGTPAIIGLIGFSGMLKSLCMGVKLDDPYADAWLLQIENALDTAQEDIAALRQQIIDRLGEREDLTHDIATSTRPLEVPLYFSNQMAFKASYLVNDFDTLVCAAMTAKHVAVMTGKAADEAIRSGGRSVRRAFESANGYQYMGASRADFFHGTAKIKRPVKAWGTVDAEILSGERRADCAPDLPPKSFASQFAEQRAEEA